MTPELLRTLVTWASLLSGYPDPGTVPEFEYKPHSFFVEHACGGKECRTVGWYNDEGVVYLDPDYEQRDDLVVHELVHWLQHLSGKFVSTYCPDRIEREREAYHVQDDYLTQTGRIPTRVQPAAICQPKETE